MSLRTLSSSPFSHKSPGRLTIPGCLFVSLPSRAWHQARTPLATLKLVTHFLPVNTAIPALNTSASPGTAAYYIKALGGQQALARLYLEAGLILHLEGAGAMHHGAGALSRSTAGRGQFITRRSTPVHTLVEPHHRARAV